MPIMIKKLLSLVLLIGTLFAFYTVYTDFSRFYDLHGTVFQLKDCIIPNPVTTPCFYGAFGFLIAFIWSLKLLRKQKSYKNLQYFIIACVLFAWGNFAYSLQRFYATAKTGHPVGCSGQFVSNPWSTPCFIGASIFLVALIVVFIVWMQERKKK